MPRKMLAAMIALGFAAGAQAQSRPAEAISNDVVKIGLTRRLEPRDRIAELSGAAVPFKFEVHALFFSEDAVTLENELHRHFSDRALNRINARKEFFFASPSEVREVLLDKVGDILEFNAEAEGVEFRQSFTEWPEYAQQVRLAPTDRPARDRSS